MERGRLPWVTIAASEVDTNCEVDFTTTHDVIQEGVCPCDLCVCVWGGGESGCKRHDYAYHIIVMSQLSLIPRNFVPRHQCSGQMATK